MSTAAHRARLEVWHRRLQPLLGAIGRGDEAGIVQMLAELSRGRRWLAPFAFAFGGVAMLLGGVRVLIDNWRLTLIQVLPATWVWLAMYDLRLHLLKGDTMPEIRGAILVPIIAATIAGTVACYFLNAAFAFAVAQPGRPGSAAPSKKRWRGAARSPPGAARSASPSPSPPAWSAARRGRGSRFLGIVVAVLMVTYVAVPARLIAPRRGTRPASTFPPPRSGRRSASWSAPRPTCSAGSAS